MRHRAQVCRETEARRVRLQNRVHVQQAASIGRYRDEGMDREGRWKEERRERRMDIRKEREKGKKKSYNLLPWEKQKL